ncbi:hypothetical protein BDW42DRAFT_114337 [Aspergillus taichungensis]|uniref:Zn(2)-C6 fungal-type domain-containing protein n=1 Tax=Aspergillus taichungensis TaxID=482145 RepID=A0A2J5HSG4_9EURO|nr:hypothetical protein BDW42DRAFT_114337 [Aspergillus taichungensis]
MQQRRADKPRSRDGCITCKIRHVRCDQARPACGQCTKTGRKCDGYDSDLSQRQLRDRILAGNVQRRPSPNGRIILYPGTVPEREHVAVFCIHTSQALAGFFPSDFWTRLLPQLSQTEPLVRHAAAAVGAAHRIYLGVGHREEDFMLQQYNLAIRSLLSPPSPAAGEANGARQSHLTLLGCSLFVCLEILRANYDQALDHVDSGLKLIQQQSDRLDDMQPTADVNTINRELHDLFARLHMDLASFNRGMRPHVTIIGDGNAMPFAFTDLGEARRRLTLLMNQSICAAPALNTRPGAGDKPSTWDPSFRAMVEGLQAKLAAQVREFQAWSSAFDRFLRTKQGKAADPRSVLALRIDAHFARELTSVGSTLIQFRVDEREADRFTPILSMVDELLQLEDRRRGPGDHHRPFTLDAGIIRALQWVATHCHQPVVRRHAMRLLSECPRQEGFWNSQRALRIGETLVGIEEAGLSALPTEQRIPRVPHYLRLAVDDWSTRTTSLLLISEPDGPAGEKQYRQEVVDWS